MLLTVIIKENVLPGRHTEEAQQTGITRRGTSPCDLFVLARIHCNMLKQWAWYVLLVH